ncbi:MAG: hypothetical protein GEV05_27275 [Betaproteobacteria bacterium]|nr:hypothetical protein [Betaproteobacteria bacterium]
MTTKPPDTDTFYHRPPYSEGFDIGYPQENLEGEMYKYRCRYCKRLTTDINGRLENHAEDCEYRLARTKQAGTRDG